MNINNIDDPYYRVRAYLRPLGEKKLDLFSLTCENEMLSIEGWDYKSPPPTEEQLRAVKPTDIHNEKENLKPHTCDMYILGPATVTSGQTLKITEIWPPRFSSLVLSGSSSGFALDGPGYYTISLSGDTSASLLISLQLVGFPPKREIRTGEFVGHWSMVKHIYLSARQEFRVVVDDPDRKVVVTGMIKVERH